MWHKADWMGHPKRLELTLAGLLVKLANHYTTRGAQIVWNGTDWSFNCVKTNDWCLDRLLMLNSNTWKHLTMCKQMINSK